MTEKDRIKFTNIAFPSLGSFLLALRKMKAHRKTALESFGLLQRNNEGKIFTMLDNCSSV
jgi:hypothetical protein